MSSPWMKFYPRDWRGDQALRAVGIASRGLWMECLCIMHEAKPYGHLVLNGKPVEDDTLARMTGISVDEVSALLAELRQAGVLSVTSKGVIFSRRMTKDHARAQKGRSAAKKRWLQVADDVEQSAAPNGLPNGNPTTQKPETRSQNKKKEPPDGVSKKRATRLPENWVIPEDWLQEAVREGLNEHRARSEAERMKNWSRSAKHGAKLDWRATWRNWFRDKLEGAPVPRAASPPHRKPNAFDAYEEIARERGWTDEPEFLPSDNGDAERLSAERGGHQGALVDLREGSDWNRG